MMKRWWAAIALLLILVGVWPVRADGMLIYRPEMRVDETGQRAVILFDGKVQTLIVSTTFRGQASEFVWVVPVPSRPEVEAGMDEVFTALDDYTRPKGNDRFPQPAGLYGVDMMQLNTAPGVRVVETKKVDIYDIAVLEAADSQALRQWLEANNYPYPESREHLLNSYIDRDWYFVAAKVNAQSVGYAGSYLREGHATPLKISFPTEQIIYPLKISGPEAQFVPDPTPALGGKVIGAWGLETGLQGWIRYAAAGVGANPNGVVELSNDTAWQGNYALKIWGTNAVGDAYAFQTVSGLVPGKNYVFSAYARVSKPVAGNAYIKVQGSGLALKSQMVPLSNLSDWTRITLPFVPVNSSHEFDLLANVMASGGELYWDGIQIEEGETATLWTREKLPAGPVRSQPLTQNQTPVPIELYVLADKKQAVPGFSIEYAGIIPAKEIEKLAMNTQGEPVLRANKKMYLTKLTRSMLPALMVDDLVIREAADNEPVGGGVGNVASGWWRVAAILGLPLVAEIWLIGYIRYKRRQKVAHV